ncbi:MAG TPA: thioredoxin family protein [Burkholderiales bacterium]|nr:thioredoxin family protein [Burkholderiales bacterium]
MAAQSKVCDFGWKAADFDLPGVDGKRHTVASARGPKGLLVMFICNHCPYVKAIRARIVRDCRELAAHGIGAVAIMSNDPAEYPEDSFENMKRVAAESGFAFPYVLDESQGVARAYGAVCTPEFFGFNGDLELQYHGRLDASRIAPVDGAKRELFDAMVEIARTGKGPAEQSAAIGCSIKWKRA